MYAEKRNASKLGDRLDAGFYSPQYVEIEDTLDNCPINSAKLSKHLERVYKGAFYVLASEYAPHGVPFIRVSQITKEYLDLSNVVYLPRQVHERERKTAVFPGTLLFAKGGSIGNCAVVPDDVPEANISQDMIGAIIDDRIDSHFLSTFLLSKFGKPQMLRWGQGDVQPHLTNESIKNMQIILPESSAQHYIGNMVRQAERLRARGLELEKDIECLSVTEEISQATRTTDMRSSRITSADMLARLDAKYYGTKAMTVNRACKLNGTILSNLATGISNGFEERTFVEKGKVYITVSEVSSGRLNIENAPKIDLSVSVPAKAIVHERCVLVVRTGSIGNAVKVFHEDSGVSISSHLIRLEFETESCAASVAAFLNSKAGKILQQKISYGAVQPQIGQEELTALSIPNAVLKNGEGILYLENGKEENLRSSNRLTIAAKLLVEALIEGQLTESDLVAAKKALEACDRTADRGILGRLTRKGIDVAGEPPLFPDLDSLYNALDALNILEDAS